MSVDLRDAVGDRLYLTSAFSRDGTKWDVGSAHELQYVHPFLIPNIHPNQYLIICHHREHGRQVSVTETVSQSKASRGIFAFWRRAKPVFKPTYAHEPDAAACRIYGSLLVKKVTGMYSLTCVMQWVQRGAWKLTGLCFVF
jgi:hypothetical protein